MKSKAIIPILNNLSIKFIFLISLFLTSCSTLFVPPRQIPVASRTNILVYELASKYAENISIQTYTALYRHQKDYISVGNIFALSDDEFISNGSDVWMIKYMDANYINLMSSEEYRASRVYAKADISGRVVAVVIDDETSSVIRNCGSNSGNWQVDLANSITKSSNNWNGKDGKKYKILTSNTKSIHPQFNHISGIVATKVLTKQNFNLQLNTDLTKAKIKRLYYEDILEIIKESNEKHPL